MQQVTHYLFKGALVSRIGPFVVRQIRLQKTKQKPFAVCCAEGIVPRFGEHGFQIDAKLSASQISGSENLNFIILVHI